MSELAEQKPPRWLRLLLPFGLLLAFSLLCITSLSTKSASYDESHYLGLSRYLLTHGDWNAASANLHPPLSHWIHGLPLLWADIPAATWQEIWLEENGDLRGQRIIDLRADDSLLNASRLALLPVSVVLGWIVFIWSRRLYGFAGGVLSLSLYCFSPNVIAHARLITPDMTLTLFTVLSSYCLWRLAESTSRGRLAAAGLSLGLLLYSKHTALALLPILALSDVAYRLSSAGYSGRGLFPVRRALQHWFPLACMAVGILWAGYFFGVGMLQLTPELSVPIIADEYFRGALFQWGQSRLSHDFFLMGSHSTEGWWYFYLVVLAIKIPIAISIMLVGLVAGRRWLGLRFESREIYLWLPALLFLLYLSLFNTIHNGFRYLLPVYPLVFVLMGKYAESFSLHSKLRPALAAGVVWLLGACLWIWPDYLAYHNEWIGGPRNAYRWSSDSNLDWGQDLKQLKQYMVENDIPRVRLAYFGTADPAHYDIDYEYLPSANTPLRRPPPLAKGQAPSNILAVSAYQYQAVGFADKSIYQRLREQVPLDQVGYSILIFDVDAFADTPARQQVGRPRSGD